MNTVTNFNEVKPQPANSYMCWKCSGSGRFCLYVENGQPRSNTGFDCWKCMGAGWLIRQTAQPQQNRRTPRQITEQTRAKNVTNNALDIAREQNAYPNFKSSEFLFVAESKTFVAEVSDLQGRFGTARQLSITSERTGTTVVYQFSHVDKNAEGDVAGWRFVPRLDSQSIFPQCVGTSVLVIND